MDDSVARSVEGAVLAIADKADSIAGMFGLGLQPTGSKDPFALRRAANGIVKIIAEHKLPLPFSNMFDSAIGTYKHTSAEKSFRSLAIYEGEQPITVPFTENPEGFSKAFKLAISEFMKERLSFYLRDVLGLAYDTVNAVLSTRNGADDVCDVVLRAKAVSDIRDTPSFKTIAVAFKRMTNIARQARQLNLTVAARLDPSLFTGIEKRLFDAMQPAGQRFQRARAEKNYPEALRQLSELAPYIDEFFEHVMILAEDKTLQENRLSFISRIGLDFAGVADFSEIVTESTKASPERGERTWPRA